MGIIEAIMGYFNKHNGTEYYYEYIGGNYMGLYIDHLPPRWPLIEGFKQLSKEIDPYDLYVSHNDEKIPFEKYSKRVNKGIITKSIKANDYRLLQNQLWFVETVIEGEKHLKEMIKNKDLIPEERALFERKLEELSADIKKVESIPDNLKKNFG